MSFTSLGIDLSTSATGLVLLEATASKSPKLLLEREIKPVKMKGMALYRHVCTEIMLLIHETQPARIVLEGYSLNLKNASSVVPLVEIGGLLRFLMFLDGMVWYDPKAGQVKKFATGKGTTPKDKVMMAVLKRWGHESATNNTADAYVCACMGLAHANRLPEITLDMRAIAGAMPAISG
jgi:crossover junction endodeoxyribonuclease RuvC